MVSCLGHEVSLMGFYIEQLLSSRECNVEAYGPFKRCGLAGREFLDVLAITLLFGQLTYKQIAPNALTMTEVPAGSPSLS